MKHPAAQGFTLIELLVVLGIMALVTGTLVAILYQIIELPRVGNARLALDSDLRTAGVWLVRDANESAAFTGTAGSCAPFTFQSTSQTVTYALVGTTLERTTGGATKRIAHNISSLDCPSGPLTGTLAVTLHARRAELTAQTTYTLTMRVQ